MQRENIETKIEEENRNGESLVQKPYFNKLVVTDPIILFPDQWERLRKFSKEVVSAGEQSSIDDLHNEAEKEGKPFCWTQLAARPLEGNALKDAVRGAQGIVACWTKVDDETLKSPELEYIGYWTNLVNHRVNVPLANELGIHVDYVPDYGTSAVASQTLAGILGILRNLPKELKMTQQGKWHYELLKTRQRVPLTEDQIPQEDLWFKKVGIVGYGHIGERVAKLLNAYDCDVSYWSRKRRSTDEERSASINYKSLDEIFSTSDIVSVHLSPYSGDKIISKELIGKMKKGSVFVNTSAGGLVDQDALFQRLNSGDIRAYLDVYDGLPPKNEVRDLSSKGNLFTYRAGWFTRDAVRLKGEMFLSNIRKYVESKTS